MHEARYSLICFLWCSYNHRTYKQLISARTQATGNWQAMYGYSREGMDSTKLLWDITRLASLWGAVSDAVDACLAKTTPATDPKQLFLAFERGAHGCISLAGRYLLTSVGRHHVVEITWPRALGWDHLAKVSWLRALSWDHPAELTGLRSLRWAYLPETILVEPTWLRSFDRNLDFCMTTAMISWDLSGPSLSICKPSWQISGTTLVKFSGISWAFADMLRLDVPGWRSLEGKAKPITGKQKHWCKL